jgi:hypothetical protein
MVSIVPAVFYDMYILLQFATCHTEAVHIVRVDRLHCAQSVLYRVIVMWNSHCITIISPVVSCVRAGYEGHTSLLK